MTAILRNSSYLDLRPKDWLRSDFDDRSEIILTLDFGDSLMHLIDTPMKRISLFGYNAGTLHVVYRMIWIGFRRVRDVPEWFTEYLAALGGARGP